MNFGAPVSQSFGGFRHWVLSRSAGSVVILCTLLIDLSQCRECCEPMHASSHFCLCLVFGLGGTEGVL